MRTSRGFLPTVDATGITWINAYAEAKLATKDAKLAHYQVSTLG